MENAVAEVKTKNDIIEVIGSYVQLKKAGKHFHGLCPFHQEKSPSFVVSPDRQMWYCFGACHEGGDVISFVMKIENISFYEALQELARRAGVQLKDVKFQDREWDKKEVLYKINHVANEFFRHILLKTKFGEKALEYLRGRNLNDKIIDTFEIGYAPDSWDSLLKFLKKKGFQEQDILRTGVLVKSERGSIYDRFRGRITFPIRDIRDNIIGFSGRIMTSSKEAKYINVPETEIYHKRESLYGIHITKDEIRKHNSVVVVEGEFDVIGPYQQGISNIVAIKGSSVTKEHLRILKRYAQKIILCLDQDAAGQDAVVRTIREAEQMDIDIFVMELSSGKDPDEVARTNSVELKEGVKNAIPAYDYLLQAIKQKYPDESPFEKKKAVDDLIPFLFLIKNPILLSHYMKHAADLFAVPEDAIREMLNVYSKRNSRFKTSAAPEPEKPSHIPKDLLDEKQTYILGYLFQKGRDTDTIYQLLNDLLTHVRPEHFRFRPYEKIIKTLIDFRGTHALYDEATFYTTLDSEVKDSFNTLTMDMELIKKVDAAFKEDLSLRGLEMVSIVLEREEKELEKRNDSEGNSDKLDEVRREKVRVKKLLTARKVKR